VVRPNDLHLRSQGPQLTQGLSQHPGVLLPVYTQVIRQPCKSQRGQVIRVAKTYGHLFFIVQLARFIKYLI